LAMIKRFLFLIICAAVILFGGARLAAAQDSTSTDPLADAARKAQAQKKTEPRPTKVYTDDNIGSVPGQISVVGPGAEGASAGSDQSGDKDKNAAPEKKDEAYYRRHFAGLRAKLADDQKKLDDLQHDYGVKQQQYYSDPNTAMKEEYTRKDIDDTQAEIDKKKQDVADDQQAISDLEDDLRRNGGDAGWEREDTTPAPASSSPPSPSTPPSPSAAEPPAGSQPGQPGEVVTPPETSTPPPTPAPEPSTAPSTPPSE
jgi:hypothetical protein